jgi:hypothetical protein
LSNFLLSQYKQYREILLAKSMLRETTTKLIDHENNKLIQIEDDTVGIDPWETNVKINYTSDSFTDTVTLTSAGPDREFGTQDDLKESKSCFSFTNVKKKLSKLNPFSKEE